MENTYLHFLNEAEDNRKLVLATLIRASGSTPQVAGASALFGTEGLVAGTLGGGLMENETGRKATSALRMGKDQLLEFDLQSNVNDDHGAICGGQASVLIECFPEKHTNTFRRLRESLEKECQGVMVTRILTDGEDLKGIERYWYEHDGEIPDAGMDRDDLQTLLKETLTNRKPVLHNPVPDKKEGYLFYLEPVLPDPRLVIAGAGHIGRALTHLAHLSGFNVTVIDNRPEMADRKYLPDADRILTGAVDEVLKDIALTENTFVVIVTQGHRHDTEALKVCIQSGAAYVGMIGSRRKVKLMREQFIREGWATPEEYDRVHAPIGLAIHAETIQEIAVSIMAELIKCSKETRDWASLARPNGVTIAGVVLAAGESRRMGRQKLLMPYIDKSFIETILDKISASTVDHTVVVVGHEPERIAGQISDYPVRVVLNERYREGMLSSIQAGLKALPSGTGAFLVFLGDQPMVSTPVIDRLIEAYRQSDRNIVVPVFKGKKGHPVLIDTRYREVILELDPEIGLRQLLREHDSDVLKVNVDSPDILKDIDTIEEYRNELN